YEAAAVVAAELRSVGAMLDVRSDHAAPVPAGPIAVPRRRSAAGVVFALLGLAAAAAIALIAFRVGGEPARGAVVRMWRHAIGPPPAPVIAVLPLELEAPDPAKTYFADGLTEDLISRLGQTPGLKVLGRSATRSYRGRTPADVAHDLG